MRPREDGFRPLLAAILGAGVIAALVVAALTDGDPFDMESFRLVGASLHAHPLHVYEDLGPRWPYPPGIFPWVGLSERLAGPGLPFAFLVRLPAIAAVAATAWLVQSELGRRGAAERRRLAAAALVSLGPAFVLIAGYHGQFDALAMLPAVAALVVWQREGPGRAWQAGLLLGIGGALKTVPVLLGLALAPSARSWRERAVLAGAAAVPIVVAFAPYALAGTLPSLHTLAYRGVAGIGGISLVVQPDIAGVVLGVGHAVPSGAFGFMRDHGVVVVVVGLLVLAAIAIRARPPALAMSVLLWLGVYAFGVNFFFQYALWGLPFFLLAGYLREVLVAQVALLVAGVIFYARPWTWSPVGVIYPVLMVGLWVAACVAFVLVARRVLGYSRASGAPGRST